MSILAVLVLATSACETAGRRAATAPPARANAPSLASEPAPVAAPAPKLQEAPQAPRVDPVVALLERVRREYEAGQTNYAAGHMEAARKNFDRAFDLLLTGPAGVRSDPRLQQEFDRIVQSVHDLEVAALKEGDGFTEQEAEPAPIDEANAVTFPVDPNLRARAEAGLGSVPSDIPLVINDVVASYISYFTTTARGRGTLERAWARAGRYQEMIARILREEGVPQDLIYLAQAESGFHPLALSRAGARGMWQFMAGRASEYGLQRNWWLDERQDPEKATRAAAQHLRDLYHQFGDWHLALAAYNSGPGNVQKGVQRTGYADFWELYKRSVLPQETKNYVPIILAVAIIAKNPEQYGLRPMQPDPPLEVDRVIVDYALDLRLAAEAVDVSGSLLQDLNPSLLRLTTPSQGEFELRLPAGTREAFLSAMAAVPKDKRVSWRFHKVSPGDTLSAIARLYGTTSTAIAEVNQLEGDQLLVDARLVIPVTPRPSTVAYSKRPTYYKVRRGDTVYSVANDFGVPAEKIRSWNRIKGDALKHGRTLRIYRPVAAGQESGSTARKGTKSPASSKLRAAGENGKKIYTVQPGDTLYTIALTYNTTVSALRRDNGLTSSKLMPGDTLVINSGR